MTPLEKVQKLVEQLAPALRDEYPYSTVGIVSDHDGLKIDLDYVTVYTSDVFSVVSLIARSPVPIADILYEIEENLNAP